MNKIQLPTVTCLIVDCLNANRAVNALEICKSYCDFGATKLLTSIPINHPDKIKIKPLNSLVAYSIFMLTKAIDYIDTPNVLIIQRDGFIINPSSWDEAWLQYDYIAPLFIQYPRVGSGGFSLRSRALMSCVTKTMPEWDWTQKQADEIQSGLGLYEDGITSLTNFNSSFNFAPPDEAGKFAQGGCPDPSYFYPKPFGFHGSINAIDHTTGIVSPVCSHGGGSCGCVQDHVNFLQQNEWAKQYT